jgi:hypothetical protein
VKACLEGPEKNCGDVREVKKFFDGKKLQIIYKDTHEETHGGPEKMIESFVKGIFVDLKTNLSQKHNFYIEKNYLEYHEMFKKKIKKSFTVKKVDHYNELNQDNILFAGFLRLAE